MNNKLAPYSSTLWLCEPSRLQQLAAHVASFDACFDKRQVAEARRKEMDLVQQSVIEGSRLGLGFDLPEHTEAPTKAIRIRTAC